MSNVLKIAGLGMLAAVALVFVFRGEASANDRPTCVPTSGFIPQFCVNVPVGTSVRRETAVPLSTVLAAGADVRVESGVPAPEVARLSASIDGAIARVEHVFDRSFTTRPRIFVFATRASFARGTQDLFGYTHETATNVADSYGGVFDAQTMTIAVSWQSAAGAGLADLLTHELTHLATREMVGADAAVPAWFEEGLAALVEAGDGGVGSDAQLTARSLLANAPQLVDGLATLADWHRAHARIGSAIYAVSAETVRALDAHLGRDGLFALLADVGRGARFEDAYRARAGDDLDQFIARFAGGLTSRPSVAVGDVADAGGNLRWTLTGFAPNAEVRVSISGAGYDLAHTVSTDGIGMYRGTFGATAARGAYTLTAQAGSTSVSATIDTASR